MAFSSLVQKLFQSSGPSTGLLTQFGTCSTSLEPTVQMLEQVEVLTIITERCQLSYLALSFPLKFTKIPTKIQTMEPRTQIKASPANLLTIFTPKKTMVPMTKSINDP